jgi:hypothetical protein
MMEWGQPAILPSVEDDPDSVWVEDPANGPPGYYVKQAVPLFHKIIGDGRAVRLDFDRDGVPYRIRCGHGDDEEENIEAIREILATLLGWIDWSVLTWREAFAAFVFDRGGADGAEWWRVLRLPPDATRDEIEAGYKRQCLQAHPDRGGSHAAFLRVQQAYNGALAQQDEGSSQNK